MSFLQSIEGASVTLQTTSKSAHEVLHGQLQTVFPNAGKRTVNDVLEQADDMLESVRMQPYKTDDIGRVVLIGSAVAVALQGRKTAYGAWKPGLVPKGKDPELFWETRITSPPALKGLEGIPELEGDYEPQAPVLPKHQEIMYAFAQKNSPLVVEIKDGIVKELTKEGGLFEGMQPKLGNIYTLAITPEQREALQAELRQSDIQKDLDTSWYFGRTHDILLGVSISHDLQQQGAKRRKASGVLAHEIGHAFTSDWLKYKIEGVTDSASSVSELLAEHVRTFLGYKIHEAYAAERRLAYRLNGAAQKDILQMAIDGSKLLWPQTKQDFLKLYAHQLIQLGGTVLAGLVLGAAPLRYRTYTGANFEKNDITMLQQPEESGRYSVLQHYVPSAVSRALQQDVHLRGDMWNIHQARLDAAMQNFYAQKRGIK